MVFDYKKEYKELYAPKSRPSFIDVPKMNYLAVRGSGDPNQEDGDYKNAIDSLYAIAFTLKMSYLNDYKIDGYFKYVVPPLEGLWWQDDSKEIDYTRKADLNFISMIRLPDFVTKKDFAWAIAEAARRKQRDFSHVEFFSYNEGLCVQCLHVGSYDDEPATIAAMHNFMQEKGCQLDISKTRLHHEIYLSDPGKTRTEKLKTVIRHPVKKTSS